KAAGLVDTLNTAEDITVFAPSNDAFKKVDKATLTKAMGDPKGLLTDVLTAHVVSGRLSPEQLSGEHKTLNDSQPVKVSGSGESFTVNGKAKVICGNVQTANATVYIIDSVLLPTS
ncbi:MAG: fasciclin domain-containing protein, partial [Actinomycetes bacterium]